MEKKHQVHNLIILDESGSMESIKDTIIQGFNELVQTIHGIEERFPEQEHFITFISFNGLGQKLLHFIDPASKLKKINAHSYRPESFTPLFDALGYGINKMKQVLQDQTDYNVLVTVMTDGEENASREFTALGIKTMVEELREDRWTFAYIGTDHDVVKMAASLSIRNTLAFPKNQQGIEDMFIKERKSRINYNAKIHSNEATETDYFDEVEEGNNK